MILKLSLKPWEKITSLGDCCVFDIEGNGLMPFITKYHCAVIIDLGNLKEYRYYPHQWKQFLAKLGTYKCIIGHNIAGFDCKVLKKLFDFFTSAWRFDTLVLSRLVNPERPQGHSLESWGRELRFHKGTYGETTDWKEFTEEMLEYCAQDVRLNVVLFLTMIRNLGWNSLFHISLDQNRAMEAQVRAHDLEVVYVQET